MSNDPYGAAISALQQQVARAHARADAHDRRIHAMEAELSNLANVLERVGRSIEVRVDAANVLLGEVKTRLEEVEAQIVRTSEREVGTMVQLEVVPLVADATLASTRAQALQLEVDSRFDKAWEGVFLNRVLYDKHFSVISDEFESKIRKVGEHIYDVLSDLEVADSAARVPESATTSLPVEVDLASLSSRSAQLDEDLDLLHREHLTPLVGLEEQFESAMAAEYSLDASPPDGTRLLVPCVVAMSRNGATVIADSRALHDQTTGTVVLAPQGNLPEHQGAVADPEWATRAMSDVQSRPMTAEETGYIRDALRRLAEKQLISERMLGGYLQYLDGSPMQLIVPAAEPDADA